ncbi:MAG: MarR family transcriptional regulator [Methylovirgula sp.]|uniref:MarR family winged helix-turn-helix transcriptional regulator n=1 Tax=Methylovirgula sp. TaxID=1978224 RepID=UPI0030761792
MTRNKQEAVRGDAAPRQRPKQPLFVPPVTISNETFWVDGRDDWLRETLYLMVLCLNQLHTFREAFGRAMDLTSPQFAVLMGTAYTQGVEGVSIGTLATHVHLAPTHVTTEVGRLIRLGLLQKRPNNEDRRSVLVRLSPQGEKAIRAVVPLVRSVNDQLFDSVTRDELQSILQFFRRFATNSEIALTRINSTKRPAKRRSAKTPD